MYGLGFLPLSLLSYEAGRGLVEVKLKTVNIALTVNKRELWILIEVL